MPSYPTLSEGSSNSSHALLVGLVIPLSVCLAASLGYIGWLLLGTRRTRACDEAGEKLEAGSKGDGENAAPDRRLHVGKGIASMKQQDNPVYGTLRGHKRMAKAFESGHGGYRRECYYDEELEEGNHYCEEDGLEDGTVEVTRASKSRVHTSTLSSNVVTNAQSTKQPQIATRLVIGHAIPGSSNAASSSRRPSDTLTSPTRPGSMASTLKKTEVLNTDDRGVKRFHICNGDGGGPGPATRTTTHKALSAPHKTPAAQSSSIALSTLSRHARAAQYQVAGISRAGICTAHKGNKQIARMVNTNSNTDSPSSDEDSLDVEYNRRQDRRNP
ncbi:hypothetical protein CEUSTIGMA_g7050.t1 [Chlamydomonas eustigma]|uniref:Uncharacterized protein n=1 Tax=Chlamydomonas eustigma TaxID=1157962 RepID=A0A250X9P0_9CHLO|nr:hypothetical protein CEUSTIGMA_g7050.t1 [Chlamydomonas eustigma]|eukprot:GAX79609.1 hypothetical protein CEUSTIGMA_g7050.t1 [Chlamydomonas eustigma]